MARAADEVGLDLLQLHGDEPPEAFAGLPRRALKAVRVGRASLPRTRCATRAGGGPARRHPPAGETVLPGGTGRAVRLDARARASGSRSRFLMLAGGLTPENVAEAIAGRPAARGRRVERRRAAPGSKDPARVRAFVEAVRDGASRPGEGRRGMSAQATRHAGVWPDAGGHFGPYGGRYVPETLMEPLRELEEAYAAARRDPAFEAELRRLLARLRGPAHAARPRRAPLGAARLPRAASSARTSATPAPTRSTTPSGRRCS